MILTRKDRPFVFGPEQLAAQEDLKQALIDLSAIRAINYKSDSPVILAVDTSHIAVGYHLCQCNPDDPKKRRYVRFGSITLNDQESRFSQPKLELYGLYRSFRTLKLYLIGVRNLVVEVDARYIKGMLSNPDLSPGASINRWILSILTFHFILVHVPGTMHGPDGLLRRRPRPGDEPEPDDEDFDDWIDDLYGFMHMINASPHLATLHSKVMAARVQAAVRFKREHAATIRNFDFTAGDLVLVRNTAIEKSLNCKMRARYLGPLVVVLRNKGGAYIIYKLNGSVFDRPVAAFRVIPYFACKAITIPDL